MAPSRRLTSASFSRQAVSSTPIYEQREVFEQVAVNPQSGTVKWPGEVDLDPEVLYGRYEPASGHRIERRTVREPVVSAG